MAYDAKDPDTIKAVKAAVAAGVAEREAELAIEHESEVEGLKAKRTELLGKIAKMKKGEGSEDNTAEIERLETELNTAKKDLNIAQKSLKKVETERDTFKATAETESKAANNLYIETGLTDALVGANVGKQFMPAAKAMLSGKASVKIDGDKRTVEVDGKPLSEFVKAWSQSDEGKIYVTAPANGGGNALGGKANGETGKVIPYADYQENPSSYAKELREGAKLGPQTTN